MCGFKHIIFKLFLICAGLLSACRSLSFEEFRSEDHNSQLLPALHIAIDTLSFETFYWNDPTAHPYPEDVSGLQKFRYVRDIRVQDAIVLFERDVKDNLTDPLGSKYGYITCKIVTGECRYSAVNALLSLATLFIPNLFGLPFNNHMTHIELEVEIYDVRENMVARYDATGYSKVPIALWRGYSTSDAFRLSNMNAFKQAMSDIKRKIAEDYQEINQKLLTAGPFTSRYD